MTKLLGKDAWQWGALEANRVVDWILPVALTAGLTYGTKFVAALSEAGGWRAILASVLVVVGRAIYQYASDNSNEKT